MSKIYRPVIPIWIEEEDMRLIDADAFERAVMFSNDEDLQDVIYRLRDYPTIDAVEVVRSDCNGCKFVGTYDTEFPCANCARKTKDYYEPQTERSE